jgi:hypothetical protein
MHVYIVHILVTFVHIEQHIMGYIIINKNVTFVSKKGACFSADKGTRGNSVLHKKGVEELLHVEQPPCTCTMAKCVHAAGGQWAVKREEGGWRGKRREKQAEQTLLGGWWGVSSRSRRFLRSPPRPSHLPNSLSRVGCVD